PHDTRLRQSCRKVRPLRGHDDFPAISYRRALQAAPGKARRGGEERLESHSYNPPSPGVCPSGQRERAVNPSAQPTEVRILPPPLARLLAVKRPKSCRRLSWSSPVARRGALERLLNSWSG